MNANEKYSKLLALSVLYEKGEPYRTQQVQNVTCCSKDLDVLLRYIEDDNLKSWVMSISP